MGLDKRASAGGGASGPEQEAVTTSFRLPFLRVSVELPRRHREPEREQPAVRDEAEQTGGEGWRIGPVGVPSPRKTAYYLGLGALAALEVVEWPVAAAIAAGTWVAQHTKPEAPAVGTGPWDFLHPHGHNGHRHHGHGHNGHADEAGAAAVAGARSRGGQPGRGTSTDT